MLKSYESFINEIKKDKIYKSAEEYLEDKKCYLKDNLWNHDGSLPIPEQFQYLFYDKKRKCLNVNFGTIAGSFSFTGKEAERLSNKYLLTSLKGMPIEVGKNFSIAKQGLTNLENFPKHVGGNVNLFKNDLTSLIGLPKKLRRLTILGNQLEDLSTLYCDVSEEINCKANKLTSLNIPININCRRIYLSNNKLKTLENKNIIKINFLDVSNNKLENFDFLSYDNLIINRLDYYKNPFKTLYGLKDDNEFDFYFNEPNKYLTETEVDWFNKNKIYEKDIDEKTYYTELLKYALKHNSADVEKINFPKGFINDNIKSSAKGLSKFNL